MATIWKFRLHPADVQAVEMPFESEILCCDVQAGQMYLWAKVNPENPIRPRQIAIYGTGHPMANCDLKYIGTVQLEKGSLVFHVFERPEAAVSEPI